MWHLYIVMGVLAACAALKVSAPLLGFSRKDGEPKPDITDKRLALGLSVTLPCAALMLYFVIGNPDLPGRPAVLEDPGGIIERQVALFSERPLRTLLEQNPDDVGALIKLGTTYMRLYQYEEAAKFFSRAVKIGERTNDVFLRIYARQLGVAQVRANKGIVGDDAAGTFEYILTLQANEPIARFYLALRLAQQGKTEAAMAEWSSMLSEGTPLAYWKQYVREALAVARAGNIGKVELNLP